MRRALVVGINDYPSAPLTACVNDAISVASTLESHGDGSPNFSVKLLTSPSTAITRSVLKEAIKNLFAGDCDISLFYFSGHGIVTSADGYIASTDFKSHDEGVSMGEILTLANESVCKDRVIVLDCCHSGTFGSLGGSNSNVAQLAEGLSVLTASRRDEQAFATSNGASVFTELVVDALKGGAADLRGHVTPGSVYSYVDQALGAWDQRPIFKTNVTRFTSLRTITPPVPLSTLRKLCTYFPQPTDEHRLSPAYEHSSPNPDPSKVAIMKDLQTLAGVGLVRPVDEEYMYYAAMHSKACRLTALGYQYWRLAKERKL